ncbi:hypothetical protein F0U60_31100 [Archangium minus]|uniref:PLL-like beta propeller domain-containing protein n=1 Tax=Archangium minus TaxID=83450 RepID=A0ABY9WY79_9BACT|nr:hypothetical protein F0U60_31100 [Archangium minus]
MRLNTPLILLATLTFATAWADTPAVSSNNPIPLVNGSDVHLFYRATDQNLHHIMWSPTLTYQDQLSGNGTTPAPSLTGSPVSMLYTFEGTPQTHVFYRGADLNIYHIWDTNNWDQWAGPGSPLGTAQAAGDPATMVTVTNNIRQAHIFYLTYANTIMHVRWDPISSFVSDVWNGPHPHAKTHAPDAAGNPATMVYGVNGEEQHIFYRGADNNIYHVWHASGGYYWDQWAGPGGRTSAPAASGDPVTLVYTNPSNVQEAHIFYRTVNNNIHHIVWSPVSGFHHDVWNDLSRPSAGKPTVVVDGQTQHMFYRGTDTNIYHVSWDPSRGFLREQWTGPGAPTAALPASGDPAAMLYLFNNSDPEVHIFYRDIDGNASHIWDRTKFDRWTGPGGLTDAPPIASN